MNFLSKNDYPQILVGNPIESIGRSSDMVWIGFGRRVATKDYKGNPICKSEIALHIQCPWKIADVINKKIELASSDIYEPVSTEEWDEKFNWDIQGGNLFDEKAQCWIASNSEVTVDSVKFNFVGDLNVHLSNKMELCVFVNSSTDIECWRILEADKSKPHFVVCGNGTSFVY